MGKSYRKNSYDGSDEEDFKQAKKNLKRDRQIRKQKKMKRALNTKNWEALAHIDEDE